MAEDKEAADDGPPSKKLRTNDGTAPEAPTTKPRWSNAAEGVDCFRTDTAPPRNRARELLDQVQQFKSRSPDTQKPKPAAWTSSSFIPLAADEIGTIDFAPPTARRNSVSSRLGKALPHVFARSNASAKKATFSHRETLHANHRKRPARMTLSPSSPSPHPDPSPSPPSAHSFTSPILSSPPFFARNDRCIMVEVGQSEGLEKGFHPQARAGFKLPPKPLNIILPEATATALNYDDDAQPNSAPVQGSTLGRKRKRDAVDPQNDLIDAKSARWQGNERPFDVNTRGRPLGEPEDLLSQEIWRFYEYLKPAPFEVEVRQSVISRLQDLLTQRCPDWHPRVRCFGSSASGLNLPNGDIDVVVLSEDFDINGVSHLHNKRHMFRLANLLNHASGGAKRIAEPGSVVTISRAKVPLVKYADIVTGVQVDVSFENKSGLPSVDTCKSWAQSQPALPVLVSLLKVFLLQRNASEVRFGGLGGFSVICLAYHYLTTLKRLHKELNPLHDISNAFIGFLENLGSGLDHQRHGLVLNPVSLIDRHNGGGPEKSTGDKLLIVDPHNSAHNVSAGSYRAPEILGSFDKAKKLITKRIERLRELVGTADHFDDWTVLAVLYEGNYKAMDDMRSQMFRTWEEMQLDRSRQPGSK